MEDGQAVVQHRLAVADSIVLDIIKGLWCDLLNRISLVRQSERRILGERSAAEWAAPAGQESFDGMNITPLDDEELTLPKRVSPEEQRRFRRTIAVGTATEGTTVIPFADLS